MTCILKVMDGKIELPGTMTLPDGTEVQVTIPDGDDHSSFADRYSAYIGIADDLPSDLAKNLDHHIHGCHEQ